MSGEANVPFDWKAPGVPSATTKLETSGRFVIFP